MTDPPTTDRLGSTVTTPHEIQSRAEEFTRAAEVLSSADYAIALTGAGISVESGIPPFRGPGGLWTKYGEPPLDGFQRFLQDPAQAWKERLNPEGPMKALAETLRKARPNGAHHALVELERMGVLRCLVTQNVDNLHREAGQQNLLEIHGNATLLRCMGCGRRWPRDEIEIDPQNLPPHCDVCREVIKGDTVNFGEPIPEDVGRRCMLEGQRADCCLVVGTSATVYPAAQIPLDVLHRGGQLVEVNLYESEITAYCAVSLRGPGAATLTQLTEAVTKKCTG